MTSRVVPRATYRLQFHKGFTFADAEALAPYLAGLGISHVYASPILTARTGSTHGYDVIDPTRINPELGGEDGLKRLSSTLRKEGLGLIVDIVPNHMAATLENTWWADVLRCGQGSRYARFFDIDWDSEDPELRGKVLLPWLAKPLDDAERSGEVDKLGLPEPGAYRLAWWRTAGDRINWRRFFDINDLVCLRMEDEEAFEAVHATIARLYSEGIVDGVRVDHIDGVSDPESYCRKLRRRLDPVSPERPYLVVEKILLRGERLPASWGCDGTTGYDFMDDVSALQHDPAGERPLADAWAKLSGRPADFESEEISARREIIQRSFAGALEACVAAFERYAKTEPIGRELSRPALRRVLIELLTNLRVYRSYGTAPSPFLAAAAERAKKDGLPSDAWVVDLLQRWMSAPGAAKAATAFQQLSAPVAAKSVEDTAFYRYGRLLSRNDVGFDMRCFGLEPAEFHARMRRRRTEFPHGLLATATHDHKRGEDVRARLAVLSEDPGSWDDRCRDWLARSMVLRTGGQPSNGDVALLLQMIVGAWPLDLALDDRPGREAFAVRLAGWQEKALREAKLHTDWTDPDLAYESAARDFLLRLLAGDGAPGLLAEIFACTQEIAAAGAVNSLAQVLLKLTAPGVPDVYQGTEEWDFSLVDPDNRRPVDFARRRSSLGAAPMASLLRQWRNGGVKQALIARGLAIRRALPRVFDDGSYEPVAAEGARAEHVVAFLRRGGQDAALIVVPRLTRRLLLSADSPAFDTSAWRETSLKLPIESTFFDALNEREALVGSAHVAVQHFLGPMPVAVFSTSRPF